MFSSITIASSTTKPDRQGHRHHREHVDGEPKQLHRRERAEQRKRHRQARDDGRRNVTQKHEDDQHDKTDGHDQRELHVREWIRECSLKRRKLDSITMPAGIDCFMIGSRAFTAVQQPPQYWCRAASALLKPRHGCRLIQNFDLSYRY